MASIFDRGDGTGRRWPRGQKFRLSTSGLEAVAQYQEALRACREVGGRAAFDQATGAWAASVGVQPGDGAYLEELRVSDRSMVELVELLEDCGATTDEAKAALLRLLSAKLTEPVRAPP
ncbi:MAG: hypothetical protein HYZ28_26340 [Myxococcales bacterium]|nr:hypothetical protein [Myxococcales bacterium]